MSKGLVDEHSVASSLGTNVSVGPGASEGMGQRGILSRGATI